MDAVGILADKPSGPLLHRAAQDVNHRLGRRKAAGRTRTVDQVDQRDLPAVDHAVGRAPVIAGNDGQPVVLAELADHVVAGLNTERTVVEPPDGEDLHEVRGGILQHRAVLAEERAPAGLRLQEIRAVGGREALVGDEVIGLLLDPNIVDTPLREGQLRIIQADTADDAELTFREGDQRLGRVLDEKLGPLAVDLEPPQSLQRKAMRGFGIAGRDFVTSRGDLQLDGLAVGRFGQRLKGAGQCPPVILPVVGNRPEGGGIQRFPALHRAQRLRPRSLRRLRPIGHGRGTEQTGKQRFIQHVHHDYG